jgi:hypothetical protein
MDVTDHKNAMHDKETMAMGASHATIKLGEVLQHYDYPHITRRRCI